MHDEAFSGWSIDCQRMTASSADKELAVSICKTLDFPVIAVAEGGEIVSASPGAELLVPGLVTSGEAANFGDMLTEPPEDFLHWLDCAQLGCTVRVGAARELASATVVVKSAPLGGSSFSSRLWLLSLHQQESFSRQKYEREILLRISSVPIPELASEGRPLTPEAPEASPIIHELLTMIVNYLGGRCALLMRMDESHRISVIGQCGLVPAEFAGLLSQIHMEMSRPVAGDGLLGNASSNGFPYSLNAQDDPESLLKNISGRLPFNHGGIWIDGISRFGAAVTFFAGDPDHAARQFATDAYVRLGRHLETSSYNNQLLEAYRELQQQQEQIIQSGKMAAIGEMATGMAHELRQPVTAINNFCTTIFDFLEKERYGKIREHLHEYRERSSRNIDRLSRIIDHLRTFGRQEPINYQLMDMNALIDEIFSTFLFTRLARQNVKLYRRSSPNLAQLEVDAPRIEQVILNVISNACDALEDVADPTITISLESGEESMKVAISDNGPGIPPEVMGKVLDPFFTTKEAGKGTGLGLSVSHGIVKGHNGALHIENLPQGGACFTIELPLKQQ